ncbi:MAG: hypothetical protein ABIO43_10935 [Sphingomicrobium sp.]
MTRRVKDYVDIKDHVSLDGLICELVELKASLPRDCEAELRLRGDDVFGRRISISYFRSLTAEEVEWEARYASASLELREKEVAQLQEEPGIVRSSKPRKANFRAVA